MEEVLEQTMHYETIWFAFLGICSNVFRKK